VGLEANSPNDAADLNRKLSTKNHMILVDIAIHAPTP